MRKSIKNYKGKPLVSLEQLCLERVPMKIYVVLMKNMHVFKPSDDSEGLIFDIGIRLRKPGKLSVMLKITLRESGHSY